MLPITITLRLCPVKITDIETIRTSTSGMTVRAVVID